MINNNYNNMMMMMAICTYSTTKRIIFKITHVHFLKYAHILSFVRIQCVHIVPIIFTSFRKEII